MLAAPWIAAVALLIRSGVESTGGVPAALTSRLTTGVNIARWFCYCSPDDTNRFRSYLTDGDLVELRRLKIGFVRLCVAPTTIDNDGTPNAANLPYLDAAIDRLESAGLAVILDLHDTHGHLGFDQPGHDNSSLARFWTAMATHYKGRQETSLVFEILNEPIFRDNPEVWDGLQRQTVDAIRAADPERTIMVTSTRYDGIDTLAKMTPLPVANLVYTVHCYDPFIFTHQGATWSSEQYKVMRDLPFPSSPAAVAPVLSQIPEQFRPEAEKYGSKLYDAAYLRKRLQRAADWGVQNHVPVVLGEFGCYPPSCPPASRENWFAAMRDAATAVKMPTCLWAYDDALGLGRKLTPDGRVQLDPVTLRVLYGL